MPTSQAYPSDPQDRSQSQFPCHFSTEFFTFSNDSFSNTLLGVLFRDAQWQDSRALVMTTPTMTPTDWNSSGFPPVLSGLLITLV